MTDEGYTGRDNLEVMADAHRYNAWLCSLVTTRAQPGARVIDFGAGSGTFARMIRDKGFDVTCVEPDEVLSDTLRNQGFSVVRNIGELAAGGYDFIYTFNVLEHIEDDQAAVKELRRPLKPGGALLAYVPAFQILYSSMDRKVGHFRRYRRGDLARKLRIAGFDIRVNVYADSLGYAASLAYRVIGSSDGTLNPSAIRIYDRYVFPVSRILDRLVQKLVGKNALVVGVAR